MVKVLLIDNYDSFTYNLAQYLGELGVEVTVWRNDRFSLKDVERLKPAGIVISPGPGTPDRAGLTEEVIRQFGSRVPILGVCLGHQAIGEVFGGRIVPARRIMHGKASLITHDGEGVFRGLLSPFRAIRYHSLVVAKESVPACLKITAESEEGEVMGLRHREHPIEGIQFHPESVLTEFGKDLLRNWVEGLSGEGMGGSNPMGGFDV
jgi:anthranilate synthase/aminodeoxychorismate synthase-like glutamine amidotransferase